MRIIQLFIITLFILVFSGCSNKVVIKPAVIKPLPTWYLDSQQSDIESFYSVGMGLDKQDAILVALSDLISRFGITIESTYESNTNLNTAISSRLNQEIKRNIKSKISSIKISNYNVVRFQKHSYNKYLVQIKVNKEKLFNALKEELNLKIKNQKKIVNAIQDRNYLLKLDTYKKLKDENIELYTKVTVLKALNYDFDDTGYIEFLNKIENNYLYYKNNLKVHIQYDQNSKIFKHKFQSILTQKNFRITDELKSETTLLIKLDTTKVPTSSMYFDLVVYTVNIKLYSGNQQIGDNTVILKEVQKDSIKIVDKNAALHFYQELKEKDLNQIFLIKSNL